MRAVAMLAAAICLLLLSASAPLGAAQSANTCSFSNLRAQGLANSLLTANYTAPWSTSNLVFTSGVVSLSSSNTSGSVASDAIKLTSNGASNVGADAWLNQPFRFNDFFHVTFTYLVTNYQNNTPNAQAEGLAFVLLDPTAQLTAAQGTGQVNLGYNLAQSYSLAVEFDMHYDGVNYDPSPTTGTVPTRATDYACNHVEVHGSLTNKGNGPSVGYRLWPTSGTSQPAWLASNAMVNGAHVVDIEYQAGYGGTGSGLLSVWIDGSVILQYAISDTSVSSIFANNTAYFGFAASTGTDSTSSSGISADTYIYNISVYTNLLSSTNTQVTPNAPTTSTITASTAAPPSLSTAAAALNVRAYDFCNKSFAISAGAVTAVLSGATGGVVGGSGVVDWKNGSYSVFAWYSVAGTGYSIALSNNRRSFTASPYSLIVAPGPVSAATSTYTSSTTLTSLTAGTPATLSVTLRDQYSNPNSTANLAPTDLVVVINNPGTGTSNVVNGSNAGGGMYGFSVGTAVASRLGASGSPITGAIYITLFGANVVNSPVTGVLVSAASVSAPNCSLSGNALISITAGTTSTVTLTPNDVYGNPVLTPLNGTLQLVGDSTGATINATSTWLASSSTSSTPTLVYTFTPIIVDTYALYPTVGPNPANLVTVPTVQRPTVIASSVVSAAASYYYGVASSYTAGMNATYSGVVFSIQSCDPFGNRVTGANGAGYVYVVSVSVAGAYAINATCVDSGSPAPAAAVNTSGGVLAYSSLSCVYSQSSSTYSVKLAAYIAQQTYSISVTMNGQVVPVQASSTSTFTVTPANPDASQSTYTILTTSLAAGATGYLRVLVADSYGNVRVGFNDSAALWLTPIAFQPQLGTGSVQVSASGLNTSLTGNYYQSFIPIAAASYAVSVQLSGSSVPLSGSSNLVAVVPGAFVPSLLRVSGDGTAGGVTGQRQTFTLLPYDGYGNRLLKGVNPNITFVINASTPIGWSAGTVAYVPDASAYQSYQASYSVPAYSQVSANNVLTIAVYLSPNVPCFTAVGQVFIPATDNCITTLPNSTVVAGSVSTVTVVPRDANGIPQASSDTFALTLLGSNNYNLSLVTSSCVVFNGSCQQWSFTLNPTVTGSYQMQVKVITATNVSESLQSVAKANLSLVVTPAAVSAGTTTLTALNATTLTAGTPFYFTVRAYDAYGNRWATSPGVTVLVSSSATESASYGPVVVDNHDGSYTVGVAYTNAGSRLVNVTLVGSGEIGSGLQLTYIAATFSGSLSSISAITSATMPFTAGSSPTITIQALDIFNNSLSSSLVCSATFLRSYDGANVTFSPTGGATGSSYVTTAAQGSGMYTLTLGAVTLADYYAALTVSVSCGSNSPSTVIGGTRNVTVLPAALSDSLSSIANWPATFNITANTTLTLNLSLADSYGNPWGPAAGVTAISALFSATIARNTLLNVNNAPGTVAPSTTRRGIWLASYTPTLASTSWSFVLAYQGVQHTFGRTTFGVVAQAVAAAGKTELSPQPLSQTMVAGMVQTVTVQFADVYGNPITAALLNSSFYPTASSNAAIAASFYQRNPTSYCVNGAIDTSLDVSAHFNSTGLLLSGDRSSVQLNFTTGVVGTYFVMIYVNDVPMLSACASLPSTLGFAVVHAPVYLPGSIVTVSTVGKLRAGAALSFSIQLVDSYNNTINDLSTNTTLTPPNPANTTSPCNSTLPIFPYNPATATISAPTAGLFSIGITATQAGQYVLPFTLAGQLVGSALECPTVVIVPSYLYSFAKGVENAVVAGVQSSFQLTGVDVYNNAVDAADLVNSFTASFTYKGTASQPPLSFTSTTIQTSPTDPPAISYYVDLAGQYAVTIAIAADPADPTSHVPTPLSYTLTVQPESCAAQTGDARLTFRCADNTCVAAYSQCPGYVPCALGSYYDATGTSVCLTGYPTNALCPTGTTLCSLPLTSPNASYLLAKNSVNFYCAVSCPTGWLSDRYPVDCGNGVARQSIDDCPSAHVCPYTYTTCPDGSCVASGTSCASNAALLAVGTACAASGLVQCRDGRCVARAENCGTERTCPHPQVLCADGSCQTSADLCPNQYPCALTTASYLCSTGECRASMADCPSRRVCPVGWVLCPGGDCATGLVGCNQNGTMCASGAVRCVDGSCRGNHLQCPTSITCADSAPVHCADNSCAADIALCPHPPACAAPTPFVCPDGTCSTNITTCSSGITCPPSAPVLCADNSCAVSLSTCGIALPCPSSTPIRCSDGACKGSYTDCSSALSCPNSIPVRCPDGSCAISILACPLPAAQLNCSASQLRCPSGHCALSLSACPTTVSCGAGLSRCADGTCRPICSEMLALTSYSHCAAGEILCPRTAGGVACAPSLAYCPTELTCPAATPVRCVDNSCAQSSADCPVVTSLISNQFLTTACVGGGWKDSLSSCGTSVTCPPFAPVKCWDESCRVAAADCPAQMSCTFGVANAASFLCPDGSCVSTPSSCTSLIQCMYPQVKCPSDTAGGAGVFCVDDPSQCVNLFNQTTATAVCPNSYTRCRSGNCMPSVQACPSWTCPTTLPYLCPAGVCAATNASCPAANGCPADSPYKCWDGSCATSSAACSSSQACTSSGATRCADGSCTTGTCYSATDSGCPTGSVRCWDKSCASSYSVCTDASDLHNTCPASRPYRCADGYCAVTQSSCPLFPLVPSSTTACSAAKPVLCADGSCVAFGSQCPVVRPCAIGTSRCGDGSCRIAGACPTVNTCPAERPLRCQSGLCVAGLVSVLTTYLESSTASDPNCIDEAARDGLTAGVQDSRGCAYGWQKCLDGTCSPRCSVSTAGLGVAALVTYMYPNGGGNGCPISTPTKCFDGSCATSSPDCPATTGCPASNPVLCADGSCQSSLSGCSSSTSCLSGGVRCPNGQCAASFAQCAAVNNCPVTYPIRCATGQCARYPAAGGWTNLSSNALTSSCPATVTCDSQHGFLCADGTCVSYPSECRPLQACPSSSLQYCSFSQTCIPAGNVCPQANATTCPVSYPVLCSNGACVKSTRQCMSPYQPNLPASTSSCAVPQLQCFDGSCASSPLACYQRAYEARQPAAAGRAAFDVNGNVFNQSCSRDTQFPCANGLCLWSQAASTQQLCAPIAACPAAYPLRCPDGSCVAHGNATGCSALAACGSGVRCDDGSCRPSASLCVARNGCPTSAPFFCPGTAVSCVASIADCSGNPFLSVSSAVAPLSGPLTRRLLQTTTAVAGSQVCAENCDRDRAAVAQQVAVSVQADTVIDVSVDSANVVRTQIVIPAGALAANVTGFSVSPVAVSALASAVTPFASTVLSTPFSCTAGSDSSFMLNLTVKAAVDLQLPSSSSSTTSSPSTASSSVTTPCAVTTSSTSSFAVAAYTANGENNTCTGALQLTTYAMALTWATGCAATSDELSVAGTLMDILTPSYAPGFADGYGASCLCYNLTASSSSVYATGIPFCMFVSHSSSSSPYLAAFARSSADASSRCPGPQESSVNNHFLQLAPPTTLALSCTTATSDVNAISAGDICLGAFDASTSAWSCVFGDYYYRLASPPWSTTAGRATNRMQSPLPSCSASAYAFIFVQQVEPVPLAGAACDPWCEYKALILGLSIGITVLLLASAYIIWRLIRYRRKYLANKKENLALSARARHLDEYAGGLGLADEEVDMVANPLVIEMKALDDRIARMSKGERGAGEDAEGEKQLRLIRELEDEKKQLYAELVALREQMKAKQSAAAAVKGPSRASLYLRQQVQPFAPVRLSFDADHPQSVPPTSSEYATEASGLDDSKGVEEDVEEVTDNPLVMQGAMAIVDMRTGATLALEAVTGSAGGSSSGPVSYYGTMTNADGEGTTAAGIALELPEETTVERETFGTMTNRKKKEDL